MEPLTARHNFLPPVPGRAVVWIVPAQVAPAARIAPVQVGPAVWIVLAVWTGPAVWTGQGVRTGPAVRVARVMGIVPAGEMWEISWESPAAPLRVVR